MTAHRLEGLYFTLSPEERTALAFSAAARGDTVEVERLHRSAGRERWSIPDHSRAFRAISTCAMIHQAEQLELIATYWFAVNELRMEEAKVSDSPWCHVAMCAAYRFCVNSRAFEIFCRELKVSSKELTGMGPGAWLLDLAQTNLPAAAPTYDECCSTLETAGLAREIISVDDAVRNLRETYAALAGR